MKKPKQFKAALIALAAVTALLLPLCPGSASADEVPAQGPDAAADVNILVYMIASDLETEDGSATKDFEEMLRASEGFPEGIKLFVYGGGAKKWHNAYFSPAENRCVRVDRHGVSLEYADGKRNMTEPETLTDFIKACTAKHPAKRSILILWDHGGGVKGFGMDELHGNNKTMSISDISSAIYKAGTRLDIIGFDACMMASYEIAGMVSDCGRYFVASEEMEPTGGWDYYAWLSALAKNPELDSLEICKTIADTYIAWCKVNAAGMKFAMSVIDLEYVSTTFEEALSDFAYTLRVNLQSGNFDIARVQRAVRSQILSTNNSDLVDAVLLAENINGGQGEEFRRVLTRAIVYNRKHPIELETNGLSIFVPIKTKQLSGVSVSDEEGLKSAGYPDAYVEWIVCMSKYLETVNAAAGGRTLLDVVNGTENDEFQMSVIDTVRENSIDVSDSYIVEDSNGLPELFMSDENKKLAMYLSQSLSCEEDGAVSDYGVFYYKLDYFPLEYAGYWKAVNDNWLYIENCLCPFYHEETVKLSNGRIVIYGYTYMSRNGDEGILFLRVAYDMNNNSLAVKPLCYQERSSGAEEIVKDRLMPVSELKGSDEVCFYKFTYAEKNAGPLCKAVIWSMKWRNVKHFEWKSAETLNDIDCSYAVMDIYGTLYDLKKK